MPGQVRNLGAPQVGSAIHLGGEKLGGVHGKVGARGENSSCSRISNHNCIAAHSLSPALEVCRKRMVEGCERMGAGKGGVDGCLASEPVWLWQV